MIPVPQQVARGADARNLKETHFERLALILCDEAEMRTRHHEGAPLAAVGAPKLVEGGLLAQLECEHLLDQQLIRHQPWHLCARPQYPCAHPCPAFSDRNRGQTLKDCIARHDRPPPAAIELLEPCAGEARGEREEVIRVLPNRDDPLMLQRLRRLHPPGGVHHEEPPDKILCSVRNVRPELVGESVLGALDAPVDLLLGPSEEGRRRTEQDVDDHTDRPHIARRAVEALFEEDFGRNVAWRAALGRHEEVGHVGRHREGLDLAQPKVGDFELSVLVGARQQDVLRLEISVADLAIVEV